MSDIYGDGTGGLRATVTNPADSATNVTLLAANSQRRQAIIFNDSTAIMYVKFGATASAADCTEILPASTGVIRTSYRGQIDAIWASAAGGKAHVTEVT